MPKTRFTFVLSCMVDRTKLKPVVIFKIKTMPKLKLSTGVFMQIQPKGWMDENGADMWIKMCGIIRRRFS